MRILHNVLSGIRFGLAFAACYCAYVSLLYLVAGSAPFDSYGVTLPTVILVYIVGGVLGGAVVGLLLPLARYKVGATLVGILAAIPVVGGAMLSMSGLPPWEPADNFAFVFTTVGLGSVCGLIMWHIAHRS